MKRPDRPSSYSPELAQKICDHIRDGLSERQLCKLEGMPTHGQLRRWKDKYPEFCALSARARQESAEAFNDKVLELSEKLKRESMRRLETGKEFPKGTVEALKIVMQEYARQAGLRDDRNYGDRKKITLDATENVGKGMQAVYAGILKDLKDADEGKQSE